MAGTLSAHDLKAGSSGDGRSCALSAAAGPDGKQTSRGGAQLVRGKQSRETSADTPPSPADPTAAVLTGSARTIHRELVTERPARRFSRCGYCNAPCYGPTCRAHRDLLALDVNTALGFAHAMQTAIDGTASKGLAPPMAETESKP